jgi:hypothetical protein
MTYRELINKLMYLSPEQLNSTVTIQDPNDEFFAAKLEFSVEETNDVLDPGHPFLSIDN